MKKLLLIFALFVGPGQAAKLCKYNPCSVIDNWKNAGGSIGSYSSSDGYNGTWSVSVTIPPGGAVSGESLCEGNRCYCRVTSVNGNSCVSGWLQLANYAGCSNYCAPECSVCAALGSDSSCRRSNLFANITSNIPNADAVTCPASGECDNSDYKTVDDDNSCGDGWAETSGPALTISDADARGTYTAVCEK